MKNNFGTWWFDNRFKILELENNDSYLLYVYSKTDGQTHTYAVTRWRHHCPILVALFKDGSTLYQEHI